ncbi:Hypothetical protein SCF082_LOCUS18139, partial [Durusdinium trenchii]
MAEEGDLVPPHARERRLPGLCSPKLRKELAGLPAHDVEEEEECKGSEDGSDDDVAASSWPETTHGVEFRARTSLVDDVSKLFCRARPGQPELRRQVRYVAWGEDREKDDVDWESIEAQLDQDEAFLAEMGLTSTPSAATTDWQLREEAERLRIRLAAAESEREQLKTELHQAEAKRIDMAARLQEREKVQVLLSKYEERLGTFLTKTAQRTTIDSRRASLQSVDSPRSRRHAPTEDAARQQQDQETEARVLQLHSQVDQLKAELEEARAREAAQKARIDDLCAKLEAERSRGHNAREEYDASLRDLRANLESSLAARQLAERQRLESLEADLEAAQQGLRSAKASHEDELAALRKSHAASESAGREENERLRGDLEAAQMELATIKVDLATRRSDEDDLILRLERQAKEQKRQEEAAIAQSRQRKSSW